jgi:hypothetical protein
MFSTAIPRPGWVWLSGAAFLFQCFQFRFVTHYFCCCLFACFTKNFPLGTQTVPDLWWFNVMIFILYNGLIDVHSRKTIFQILIFSQVSDILLHSPLTVDRDSEPQFPVSHALARTNNLYSTDYHVAKLCYLVGYLCWMHFSLMRVTVYDGLWGCNPNIGRGTPLFSHVKL